MEYFGIRSTFKNKFIKPAKIAIPASILGLSTAKKIILYIKAMVKNMFPINKILSGPVALINFCLNKIVTIKGEKWSINSEAGTIVNGRYLLNNSIPCVNFSFWLVTHSSEAAGKKSKVCSFSQERSE